MERKKGTGNCTTTSIAGLVDDMQRAEQESRHLHSSARSDIEEQNGAFAGESSCTTYSMNPTYHDTKHSQWEQSSPDNNRSIFEADAKLAWDLQKLELESHQSPRASPESCARCGHNSRTNSGLLARFRGGMIVANGRRYCEGCFRCIQCDKPIRGRYTFDDFGGLYHSDCAYEKLVPNCRACGLKVAKSIGEKMVCLRTRYWNEILCGHHTQNELSKCSSCQRLQPLCLSATGRPEEYAKLSDGKLICLSCLSLDALLSTEDAAPLYDEIACFVCEQLGMKLRYRPPFHLVTYDALNSSKSSRSGFHDHGDVRGVTLSEDYIRKKESFVFGIDKFFGGSRTAYQNNEPVRTSEVSAILVLVGLPYLTTGEILAHELTHAYFRLNNFGKLDPQIEEGVCQLIAYLWLNYKLGTEMHRLSSRNSAYSRQSDHLLNEQRTLSNSDLCEFLLWQIEQHPSPIYGQGFKLAKASYDKYGFDKMIQSVRTHKLFPQ